MITFRVQPALQEPIEPQTKNLITSLNREYIFIPFNRQNSGITYICITTVP